MNSNHQQLARTIGLSNPKQVPIILRNVYEADVGKAGLSNELPLEISVRSVDVARYWGLHLLHVASHPPIYEVGLVVHELRSLPQHVYIPSILIR